MSEDPKLITRVITFELTKLIRPRYINVTDEQMERQTDRRTTYCSNTAQNYERLLGFDEILRSRFGPERYERVRWGEGQNSMTPSPS